ncbi:MAG: glycoside hydrolase family 3 C-terminal domain-containing protein, partial [Bacteroidota bacterium]
DNSRWVLDVEVDERTLREVYLPHFKKSVPEGKPASIMSAYNAVNGDFCGSNKMLLTDILREDWEFEGFVSTDWIYGVYDGVGGVKAGLNVEMPFQKSYSYEALQEGIDTGEISEADIDKLVVNTLATRLRYAYNNHPEDYPASRILEQSSIDLSREAAEEGIVLLKNENVLPFQQKQGKKVAVIGRLADVENTGDQGSSNSTPPYVITPYQGIKDYQTALGNEVVLNDGSDLDAAKQLAEEADEVIVIVGFTHEDEGEYIILNREDMLANAKAGQSLKEGGTGGDRADLSLSESDEALIQKLAGRNLNLAVVYVGGSAIDLSTWEDKVPAILFAWYAGMEGGNALANVLYGEVSPSGKLPFSIAKSQEDYPKFTPFATQIKYDYYHGYTLFDKQEKAVAYPFGFGLSYANFSYDSLSIQQAEIASSGSLEVQVKVTNNSAISAKEIVQLYIGFPNSPVDRPVKLLRDFNKIALAPQESKWVNLSVAAEDLAWYNPEKESWVIDAVEYEVYVGGSSEEGDLLKGRFKVMENRER